MAVTRYAPFAFESNKIVLLALIGKDIFNFLFGQDQQQEGQNPCIGGSNHLIRGGSNEHGSSSYLGMIYPV